MTNNPNHNVVEKLAAAIGVDIKSIAKTLDFYGRPYRVYTALLSQVGTDAPTAIELENTIGYSPSFRYDGVGVYSIVFGEAFPREKVVITYNPSSVDTIITNNSFVEVYYNGPGSNESKILIGTGTPGGPFTDELMTMTSVEIRVYK